MNEQLKIVVVGHVDHGKSTLIGRLFHDSGRLPEGKLEQLQQIALKRGMPFEWANLMDSLQAERDQNITIDTAQIWFQTAARQYVIIDAPGHKEFLKNMVTGAAHAEAALLVIDAAEGVRENSKRHGYLLHLLGIRQLAVVVNKMDLVAYSESRFNCIATEYRDWLRALGLEAQTFIPVIARDGDNIAVRSDKMPWYGGPTLMEALDAFKAPIQDIHLPFRFPVQDVYRFDDRRILAGRVESGRVRVGDRLVFTPTGKTSTVRTIERWNAPACDFAETGESIGITLTEQIFVERGAVAAQESRPPYELTRIKARVFWLGKNPFKMGRSYTLKLVTQNAECWIEKILTIIDASTLEAVKRVPGEEQVGRFEVADLEIRTLKPLAFDPADDCLPMGRFVIVDGYDMAGGGVILPNGYPRRTADSLHKSQNIFWTARKITEKMRSERNGHTGRVVWLTGLSCSGKTTLADALERALFALGRQVYVLDGDNMRHGLCSDLAFTPEDRRENIRRVGEVAKLFADAGIICITAFISPYRQDRDNVRQILPPGGFVEVFLDIPIEVCEARDLKGLYAKARKGQIGDFTGVSAPYEAPLKPEIILSGNNVSVEDSVLKIMDYLNGAS